MCDPLPDCGGIYSLTADEPTLTLTSPNYPKAYSTNMECFYLVEVVSGSDFNFLTL